MQFELRNEEEKGYVVLRCFEENLRRREVAPESEVPIGVGNRDIVKFIGGAHGSALIVFLLRMETVECERAHRRCRRLPPASNPRIVVMGAEGAESRANPVQKHNFGVRFDQKKKEKKKRNSFGGDVGEMWLTPFF